MAEWLTLMERYLDPALYDDRVKELTGHVVVARFLDSETTQTPSKFALHVGELQACMARKYEMEHPNEELPTQLAAGSSSHAMGRRTLSQVMYTNTRASTDSASVQEQQSSWILPSVGIRMAGQTSTCPAART
jgi:hypothetical protein